MDVSDLVTQSRMDRGYAAAGPKMGRFVQWIVDDAMRSRSGCDDPGAEIAARQAVADAAARWLTRRARAP